MALAHQGADFSLPLFSLKTSPLMDRHGCRSGVHLWSNHPQCGAWMVDWEVSLERAGMWQMAHLPRTGAPWQLRHTPPLPGLSRGLLGRHMLWSSSLSGGDTPSKDALLLLPIS